MKPHVRACAVVVLLAAAAVPATAQIQPVFAADELLLSLIENLMPVPLQGPTPWDLYAAAGVTLISDTPVTPPEVVEHLVKVRLNPGTAFGRAFRAIQTFDFGPGRWQLRYVQPNYFYALPPPWGPMGVARTFNFSARAEVRSGDGVTIGGMIVPGEFPRLAVFKVRGASLDNFDIAGALRDPVLHLYEGNNVILANDNWGDLRDWEKGLAAALCPPPDDSRESMIVTFLDPGAYTVVVRGASGSTGIALLEMYLLDAFRLP